MAQKKDNRPQPQRPDPRQELALGKAKFLIQRGVVGWGLPTFFIYMLLYTGLMVITGRSMGQAIDELFPFNVVVALVVFALAGLFIGSFRWKKLNQEIQAKQAKKQKQKKGGKQ